MPCAPDAILTPCSRRRLNFFFRFAFAAYKSTFAFFCAAVFNYEAREVGVLLSGMGIAGMFVQGVLVRVVVSRLEEGRTLLLAMMAVSAGFVFLSYAFGLATLVPALGLIAIGYGLAVPCLSALFSDVPVEQGVMQGFAGAIDRFGQAFGPLLGSSLLHVLGEQGLMRFTGCSLAAISSVCMLFIGEGEQNETKGKGRRPCVQSVRLQRRTDRKVFIQGEHGRRPSVASAHVWLSH